VTENVTDAHIQAQMVEIDRSARFRPEEAVAAANMYEAAPLGFAEVVAGGSAIVAKMAERKERLSFQVVPRDRMREAYRFLEQEVWPQVPKSARGRRLSRKEEDRILGYGPEGV